MRTVSELIQRLMAVELEYGGDLPVKVEIWSDVRAPGSDVAVFSVMEFPLVEGRDPDGNLVDSYGDLIPGNVPEYIVITLEEQFERGDREE
jgi:hypothetical protein